MEKVKQHFEAEAQEFDAVIRRLIPYYEQMLEALLLALRLVQISIYVSLI